MGQAELGAAGKLSIHSLLEESGVSGRRPLGKRGLGGPVLWHQSCLRPAPGPRSGSRAGPQQPVLDRASACWWGTTRGPKGLLSGLRRLLRLTRQAAPGLLLLLAAAPRPSTRRPVLPLVGLPLRGTLLRAPPAGPCPGMTTPGVPLAPPHSLVAAPRHHRGDRGHRSSSARPQHLPQAGIGTSPEYTRRRGQRCRRPGRGGGQPQRHPRERRGGAVRHLRRIESASSLHPTTTS